MRKPSDERIHLRLPADEKAAMEAEATKRDMALSEFVRWLFRQPRKEK